MARISDYYDDRFLGKWHFDPGEEKVVTIDHVGMDDVYTGGKKETKTCLFFSDSKPMVLNKTNAKIIAGLYGMDTERWRGRKVTIFVDMSVRNPRDKTDPGGIRVRPWEPKTEELLCSDCGRVITDAEIGGKMYRAKAIAENARTKFGRCLCASCAAKAREEAGA